MMRHGDWPFGHDDDELDAARGRGRDRGRPGPRGPVIPGAPPAWGAGPGAPPGGGWGGPRGPFDVFRSMFGRGGSRRGRGDVRAAILLLLSEQACNGYQLMQEIERRSDGTWRPSSGSIYPGLQQLEDEGLVTVEDAGAGKLYKLSARGAVYVAKHREELGTPWQAAEASGGADPRLDLMTVMAEIAPALQQVMRFGTREQIAEARRVVGDARRALYRILAETGEGEEE